MSWLGSNRKNKQAARDLIFDCGPRHSVLLLPGCRCECVKTALRKGVITKDTVCTFVERDLDAAIEMMAWVEKEWKGIPPLIHQGELCDLEMLPTDMAFIDLFGNITKADMDWIQKQLIPNLMPGSDLAFTFGLPVRSNEFVKNAMGVMMTKYADLFQAKQNALKIESQHRPIVAFYDILFEHLLKGYSFNLDFLTYKDGKTYTMLLMLIRDIRKTYEKMLSDMMRTPLEESDGVS